MSTVVPKLTFLLNVFHFIISATQTNIADGVVIISVLKDLEEILPLPENQYDASSNHKYIIIMNNPDSTTHKENTKETNINNIFRETVFNTSRKFSNHLEFVKAKKYKLELREKAMKLEQWQRQHAQRMAFVKEAITKGYLTALYIYRELQRIKRQRVVMDKMRKMIAHLDQPLNEEARAHILECYRIYKPVVKIPYYVALNTNNLVRHDIRDPYNDGTWN